MNKTFKIPRWFKKAADATAEAGLGIKSDSDIIPKKEHKEVPVVETLDTEAQRIAASIEHLRERVC